MERLDPKTSLLFIVDMQDRLVSAMSRSAVEGAVANAVVLLESARLLGIPIVASEQYPKGLGRTVNPIAEQLREAGVTPIAKLTFDAVGEPELARAVFDHAPRSVVVLGLEAHVCVFQTARELVRRGVDTRVVADAVASRSDANVAYGLALCASAGAFPMPSESVVFDWLGQAGTDEFRIISRLLRGRPTV